MFLGTLAAAYAEAGHFDKAVRTAAPSGRAGAGAGGWRATRCVRSNACAS